MASVLEKTSETYRQSASDFVMREHPLGMACWDLEELITLGLGLFESYNRMDSRWREGVRRGDPRFQLTYGNELRRVSDPLVSARRRVLELVEQLHNLGHVVDGSDLFRKTSFQSFEERTPLEVPFTEMDFVALSAVGPKAPETAYDGDDNL